MAYKSVSLGMSDRVLCVSMSWCEQYRDIPRKRFGEPPPPSKIDKTLILDFYSQH